MGAENAEAKTDKLVGSLIQDRFLVRERIAAGGMGVVYKAEQVPLGRPVALKILESKHNEQIDTLFGERFFLEAAAVAKLSHPNTIILYDYGRTDDALFYYAMEYVEGVTLSRRIFDEGPMPPRDAIHVALQICGSLRDAHAAGMVHRDLKPGNVMLTSKGGDRSFVKVLDFGLVKVMGQEVGVELTKSGMLMGSPRYMAPEQVTGRAVDHRADVYSLGTVLYHMLTGLPPFQQESQYEVLRAQVEEAPPSLRASFARCAASPRLEALVMSCLEKRPERRPQDMNALATELAICAREVGLDDISISSSCRPVLTASQELPLGASQSQEVPRLSAPASLETSVGSGSVIALPAPPPPAEGPRIGRILAVGALLVSVGVLAAVLAIALPGAEAEPAPTPPAGRAESPPPEVAPAPEPAPVRLASEPPGASVRRGTEDLGDTPVTLPIPEGERWEVTVSLDGYEPRTVTVSAGRGEIDVRLRPAPVAVVAPTEGATEPTGGRRRPTAPPVPVPVPVPVPLAPAADPGSTSGSPSDTTGGSRPEAWGGRSDNRDPWAQ